MEIKIYLITDTTTGMKYVGQTSKTIERRFKQHAQNKKSLIGKAIKAHGWKNFTLETLEVCDTLESANEREMYYIAKLNTLHPNGLNLTEGGDHGARSEETCRKLSAAAKADGRRPPSQAGKPRSQATKAKLSAIAKKQWQNGVHARKRPKKVSLKKKKTPEQIHAKRVEVGRRRAQTPEGRAQILSSLEKARAAHSEKSRNNELQISPEGREKLSVSAKRRAQTPEGRAQILSSLEKARAAHSEKCRQRREQQSNDKGDQNG